jgi:hypothetical protein
VPFKTFTPPAELTAKERQSNVVTAILQEGSFDATEAQVVKWLNARHELLCVRSLCYRKKIGIAETVAGTSSYAVPSQVLQIHEVLVQSSSSSGEAWVPYGAGRTLDLAEGALGYVWLGGLYLRVGGGIFTRDFDEEGDSLLALFPTPTESGRGIQIRAVMRPPALTVGGAGLLTPMEFDDALIDGAIATGLQRLAYRGDLAAEHDARFQAACTELAAQVNRRYRGSGPVLARVAGYNA